MREVDDLYTTELKTEIKSDVNYYKILEIKNLLELYKESKIDVEKDIEELSTIIMYLNDKSKIQSLNGNIPYETLLRLMSNAYLYTVKGLKVTMIRKLRSLKVIYE